MWVQPSNLKLRGAIQEIPVITKPPVTKNEDQGNGFPASDDLSR